MNILKFNDQKAVNIALCGGKGASLAKMSQAGFAVPQGFIVTASAYKKFIANANLELNFEYGNLEILEKQSENLRKKLLNLPLPDDLKDEIKENLALLGANKSYSVRSSSTLEDLANSAFAGAHDTFLNQKGIDEITQKIKECFISLWLPRAIAYRHKQGFAQENADMAVVVQEMIFADKAGVSFAINPVNGNFDEILINANYGLGESVVCGEYDVDEYHIDKNSLNLISSVIANKQKSILWGENGTYESEIQPNLANLACLSEDELKQIAQLNIKTSAHYGFVQDIEWAIKDNKLYLLQSRPITTIIPHFTRDESAERYPSVITPLTWDYVDLAFHISLKHSFELMGLPPFNGKWFAMFDNYIYGNQNAVNLYMQTPPLNVKNLEQLAQILPSLKQKFSYAFSLPNSWNINLSNYLLQIGGLKAQNLDNKSEKEIWEFIQSLVDVGTEYFKPNIAISITQFMIYKFFMRFLQMIDESRAASWFDALCTAQTKTSLINNEILSLASHVAQNSELKDIFISRNSRQILSENLLDKFSDFKAKFEKFIDLHGHREVEFDSYIPTWEEAPHIVLDNIKNILNNPAMQHKNKSSEISAKTNKALSEILNAVPKNLQEFTLEFANLVQIYTILDDEEHYQTTRLTPMMRKGIKALGEKLVQKDIIAEPYDLFFAHLQTLETAVKSGEYESLASEIQSNKTAYLKNKNLTPKWDLSADEKSEFNPNAKILKGLPASMGVAEGSVCVVRSSDDFANFVPNSILVARTTNPAWTPLFYSAKALITESGGVLSHGAVSAREMKIPAVMAVKSVMQILQNGQKVRVDGKNGIVEILD
ncbi:MULTISPECIES: PEP/pyruvate-binding domain-containing protein [unclassified Campylobacter]|uniref:PEP/pyruvate-binding domain-containing protein n=1 Tax=unclassified Campylobacter TaxID=2593542 RepID=UPI0022E9A4D7|nr:MULTISPECIES: PEP/pyruvate-binding domain-containing protein [unclassified Campylobacter]MDA3054389.1 PEP-utilizing enzyme [Campylobacter sp. VBCF_07 NA4]MDA3060825.1 PEP-utilizing enzyme [Campylobacter sp. VBCF_02 NA5]MDA3069908.1 PEP-utilizing enzyme [Campylobacter sp. VBCF_08 NA3]WBR54348.1 PEP-utilizing enzyme [Campylobacter sp. VBCF_01 NA2]